MARQTSINTFNTIRNSGLLGKMRQETYSILYNFGPLTANQVMHIAKQQNPNKSHQAVESLGRRLSELRDLGVVQETGIVICPITNRSCIEWDVTSNLPSKPPKKTIQQKIQDIDDKIQKLLKKKSDLQGKIK